jgi:hypothetical protein
MYLLRCERRLEFALSRALATPKIKFATFASTCRARLQVLAA